MSYTVINDNGVIQVRASITSRAEMEQLAKALASSEKHLPDDTPDGTITGITVTSNGSFSESKVHIKGQSE